MAFSIDKKPDGARLVVVMKGNIDEDAQFSPLEVGAVNVVVLDLAGVITIDSIGMRNWIKWVKAMPESLRLSVRRCPKVIVNQINMIAGFLPATAKIDSFYVPYYANVSGSETMVLFENGREFKDGEVQAAPEVKDDTGEIMEMDVTDAYFKFLRRHKT
ncbi:MAG: hypothetical protein C5B49_16605 [Bdellovibrio sp.]|nr:MAG: hypothetical protein C5B49_16605 [Bdellovibrio sp.]